MGLRSVIVVIYWSSSLALLYVSLTVNAAPHECVIWTGHP